MFILIGILAFGVLIIVHELGHFAAARALGVKVNEFAIGMGPKLLKKQGRETLYTLRAFPLGGFCAMEGEDEETDDPRAFTRQKRWRRVIILVAGSAANLLFGFILVLILTSRLSAVSGAEVTHLTDGFPSSGEQGLMVGDTILTIDGERIYYSNDFLLFMSLAGENGGVVDMTVRRGGETVRLNDYTLEKHMYSGETEPKFGITFNRIEANAWTKLKYSGYTTGNFVRLVRVSIQQLISGKAGIRDLSGPVGIVSEINKSASETAAEKNSALAAIPDIIYFTAFIAINLAVMNMLPIPALDGGRILFIAISFIVEKATRKRLNPKYEGYIHAAAFVLLMGLMVFVLVNDVVKIVGG